MKTRDSSVYRHSYLFFLFIILTCSCQLVPQKETSNPSTVMRLVGDARWSRDGTNWHNLRIGSLIQAPSYVQTAVKSELILSLGEKAKISTFTPFGGMVYDPAVHPANLLKVYSGSIVILKKITNEQLSKRGEIILGVPIGKIQGFVKKHDPDSKYEVRLTNAVVTMQEGIYRLDAKGNVSLFEGHGVICQRANGNTIQLSGAQKFDAKTTSITNLFIPLVEDWHHNIWLPHDDVSVPWLNKWEARNPNWNDLQTTEKFIPPHRPF